MRLAARLLAILCLASGLGACSSGPVAWEPTWTGPYSGLPVAERLELGRARDDMEAGRLGAARERLQVLTEAFPDQIDVAVMLQDAELGAVGADGFGADRNGVELVTKRYRDLAETRISVVSLVLAARVTDEPEERDEYLRRAIELEPGCSWAHYGHAHSLLQQRSQYRWREARAALNLALSADSGHLWARRMEAWMLSQEGAADLAAKALERWLIVTEGDPRVSSLRRTRARIDLALLWVLGGRVDSALQELDALTGNPVDRARRLAVLAVAQQEGGDIAEALDTARRGRLADGTTLLPLVQEALLYQYWTGDLEAAQDKWEEVAQAAGGGDLGSLLQSFRAKVASERLAAAREAEREAEREAGLGSSPRP